MPANTEKPELDHFLEFFSERVSFVRTRCLTRIEGMILLCSYIDSLSGYRYGGSSSFIRFRRFLIEDTTQSDIWCNVSLILLRQYVEEKNLQTFSPLINVLNRLGAVKSNFLNLNHNPDISLESLMVKCGNELTAKEIQIYRTDIKRFEYTAILWSAYRNASIHETAIQLNQAMNLASRTTPFYSNLESNDEGRMKPTRTCFDIPPSFLIATIESGLIKLKKLVENGTCNLKLSTPYDRPATGANESRASNACSTVEYPRMITKPFRPLLKDIGYLLDQAKKSHELFSSTNEGDHLWREGAMARSCIIHSVFFVESIVNCALADFCRRELWQLPDAILKKVWLSHQALDRLPLIERIYLAPYLCCDEEKRISTGFFDRGSKDFQLLKELIEIRDGFAHSRPVQRQMKLTRTKEKDFIADDKFKVNFWPLTQFPKDIFIFDWSHANRAKEIVDWAVQQLDHFLSGRIVKDNWMISERIEFDPDKT